MSSLLLTAYDIATLRRHPNPKLVVVVDPSAGVLTIVDTIHIGENSRRGYAACSVDYSRIFGPALAVRSSESALELVTSRLRSAFADSGVTLGAEGFGMDGETVFDLVLSPGR